MLDLGFVLPIDRALEFAGSGVGEVTRFQLIEILDFVLEQSSGGGAEDVASRVEAAEELPFVGVDELVDGGAGEVLRGWRVGCEVAEVEDYERIGRRGADGQDVECELRAISADEELANVARLATALGVEDG